MTFRYYILTFPLFFIALILCPPTATAAEPLDRSFKSIHLGMTPQVFQQAIPSVEFEAMYLNLIAGEKFYKVVKESLPEGTTQVTVRFYKGKLYKISIQYTRDWIDEETWNNLIEQKMKRYGTIKIDRKQIVERIHEIARWEDLSTVYILWRENRASFKENELGKSSTVFVTYLDKDLWDERLSAETRFLF